MCNSIQLVLKNIVKEAVRIYILIRRPTGIRQTVDQCWTGVASSLKLGKVRKNINI
jgi:hypothetical protein